MLDINRNTVFMSATPWHLEILSQGELLLSVPVPAGRVSAADYIDLAPHGATFEVDGQVALIDPRSISGVVVPVSLVESDANPDYVPSPSDRFQRSIRSMVGNLQDRLDASEARNAQIEQLASKVREGKALRSPSEPPVVDLNVK